MNPKKAKKTAIMATLILLGIVALGGVLFTTKITLSHRLPPGTTIASIDLSYETIDRARELLNKKTEAALKHPIKITLGDESRQLTLEDLGIKILTDKTLEIIDRTRQKSIPLLKWAFPDKSMSTNLVPLIAMDYEKLISTLDENFSISKSAPIPASFYFNDAGALDVQEGKGGLTINLDDLADELKASAEALAPQDKITLKTELSSPQINKEDLEGEREKIEEALNFEFTLVDPIYSDDWELRLKNHLDWVKFTPKQKIQFTGFDKEISLDEGLIEAFEGIKTDTYISLEINQEALDAFVDEEISKWLDKEPDEVNIFFDENKKVIIEGHGNDGLKIQRSHLKKAIELAVENRIAHVPIPVLVMPPVLNVDEELRALGIRERLSTGHTSYYGSPANRVHNIKTGASKFTGTLIEPGGIFSFNDILGPVDASTGYKKELVIKHDGTKPEYGGGLCQVSTTTYRAALFAGLPIVERNEHSYAVSYYSQILGHGLDATIYLGGANLKFENDTGHHILVQMYTEDDYELYVLIYGTSDGRSVEMDGPYLSNYHNPGPTQYVETTEIPPGTTKQVEKAHTGFNALWYRYLTKANGEVEVETITTNYKAIPAKVLVGIDPQ